METENTLVLSSMIMASLNTVREEIMYSYVVNLAIAQKDYDKAQAIVNKRMEHNKEMNTELTSLSKSLIKDLENE